MSREEAVEGQAEVGMPGKPVSPARANAIAAHPSRPFQMRGFRAGSPICLHSVPTLFGAPARRLLG
jgi:hypothetical protein